MILDAVPVNLFFDLGKSNEKYEDHGCERPFLF